MKKILLLLVVIVIFSACICKPVLGGLPEGRQAKVDIQSKDFKGELLSVTSDLIVIRFYDEKKKQDVIMGFPVADTDMCKVHKGCGPIGNMFAKNRKFTFKKNTQTKIKENVADLSRDALYGSLIPDAIKDQITLFGQDQ